VYQKLTSLAQWFLLHLPGWLLAGYVASLVFIFIYSFSQAHLIVHYVRSRRNIRPVPKARLTDALPFVTVQLPVYNEKYVVARLLEAVAACVTPPTGLEIQVLDDSTDETTEIIAQKVEELSHLSIRHLRRADRRGYKAGALQGRSEDGTRSVDRHFRRGFHPRRGLSAATVAQFSNPKVGMVQTRWGHVNEAENLLTRLQAFGLDTHFTVEQTGRFAGGFFLNFNGTAGVWRKSCIEEAGGWQADTLTEDLDLSYRAQLKGWQFAYLEGVVSPAELPSFLRAYRLQQYRWTKGAAQNTRKHLLSVLEARLPVAAEVARHGAFAQQRLVRVRVPEQPAERAGPVDQKPGAGLRPLFPGGLGVHPELYRVCPLLLRAGPLQRPAAGSRRCGHSCGRTLFPVAIDGLVAAQRPGRAGGYGNRKTPFVRTPKFNATPLSRRGGAWVAAGLFPGFACWRGVHPVFRRGRVVRLLPGRLYPAPLSRPAGHWFWPGRFLHPPRTRPPAVLSTLLWIRTCSEVVIQTRTAAAATLTAAWNYVYTRPASRFSVSLTASVSVLRKS
jgi:hypothetical protein